MTGTRAEVSQDYVSAALLGHNTRFEVRVLKGWGDTGGFEVIWDSDLAYQNDPNLLNFSAEARCRQAMVVCSTRPDAYIVASAPRQVYP